MNFENIKHIIIVWFINITAYCLAFIPVLQFFALFLAIVVSVTSLIINFTNIFNIFKKK